MQNIPSKITFRLDLTEVELNMKLLVSSKETI